jgi:hypothetical protein
MRRDLYGRGHKALRAWMADTLVALGRTDPDADCEVRDALARLDELLGFCETHAALENDFIHRALELRCEGASYALAAEHFGRSVAIEELRALAARRAPDLYRRFSAFVADNLVHMESEEHLGNALLWRHFSDAELEAIETRLAASIPPGRAMQSLRWMLPAMSHPERVAMLEGMRGASPAAFEAAFALGRMHLPPACFDKLEAALSQREPATLAS